MHKKLMLNSAAYARIYVYCILHTAHSCLLEMHSKQYLSDAVINQILAHLCNLNFCKMFSIWHSVWSCLEFGIPSFLHLIFSFLAFHILHSTFNIIQCLCFAVCSLKLVWLHCSVNSNFYFIGQLTYSWALYAKIFSQIHQIILES